jgi:long-chain fatty acid transport protein
MTQRTKIILGSLLSCLVLAGNSFAGGLYLYEVATPDVGLAAAGYAARAQDAATVFTNPAGMTKITRPSLMAGAQPMYLHLDFSPDGGTNDVAGTLPDGSSAKDGDSNELIPAGGLFYVRPVNGKLWLGAALDGYFGLTLDYQNDWVGRYYVQEATLQALALQPAVAYKINDRWSVGAGVSALYGIMKYQTALNNIDPGVGDGKLKYKDEDWATQFNLGVLFEPVEGTRFGLTYLSEGDLDFKDKIKLSGVGPGLQDILDRTGRSGAKLDLGVNVPRAVMFSAYHEFTDQLALMANLGWQDWSEFGYVDVGVYSENSTSLTTDLDFKDTWHVALGAQYQLSGPWQLSAGIAYDSDMIKGNDISPALPVGKTWRFGLGSRYAWSKDITLGAAYELVWFGDLDVDLARGPLAGQVSGTFENTAMHVVSLNAEWRF